MSATGRAVRNVGGPRYRLVATFPGGDEATREEYESIPAAQAELGTFVCDLAARGRPVLVRVERILQATTGSNGKTRHEPPAAGETLRRWDVTVIDRILEQRRARADSDHRVSQAPHAGLSPALAIPVAEASTPLSAHEGPASAPAAQQAAEAAEPGAPGDDDASIVGTPITIECGTEASAATSPSVAAEDIAPPVHEQPLPLAGGGGTPPPRDILMPIAPQPAPSAALPTTEHRHAAYRPHHRRTRWVLILTAAFIAILFGGMILLETNGDPIGYLRRLGSGEKVRETLPFRNGDAAATKPAQRN